MPIEKVFAPDEGSGRMGGTVAGADLARDWSLSFADFELVNARPVSARLGMAVQLKIYALRGSFVAASADVPGEAVSWLAEQLGVGDAELSSPDVPGRSGRRHRAEKGGCIGASLSHFARSQPRRRRTVEDAFLDIAELRAEPAFCYLTKRERADSLKRLAILVEQATEAEA